MLIICVGWSQILSLFENERNNPDYESTGFLQAISRAMVLTFLLMDLYHMKCNLKVKTKQTQKYFNRYPDMQMYLA